MKLLLAALLFPVCAFAGSYQGKVVAVLDGDTIKVLDQSNTQHKIRLAGIDAPEKSQAYGQASKQNLSDLVFSKQVTIETFKHDKYNREIGKVIVDGEDANLQQIKVGLAWHYKLYQRDQLPEDRRAYAEAEESAKSSAKGLWYDVHAIPPWIFRRTK